MKKFIFPLLLVLIATSCGKWSDKKDKSLTYYCEDYKEKDMSILDSHTENIDALWVEFSGNEGGSEFEYNTYTLIVKSNGEFTKESGSCLIDWEEDITFMPYGEDTYIGKWFEEKDKYVIAFDLKDRTEELTFIYKETCKFW